MQIKPKAGQDFGGLPLPFVALAHSGKRGGVDLIAVVKCVIHAPDEQGAVTCGGESV